jgi:uracil-DNA glycosylase family 4
LTLVIGFLLADLTALVWHILSFSASLQGSQTSVTNVVKHFKWKRQGKRRIHEKPNSKEIEACRRWLEAEIAVVKPKVIVALGATAAQTLLGKQFRVTRERGKFITTAIAPVITATVHPSSIRRTPDEQARKEQMQAFVDDLKKVARFLARES